MLEESITENMNKKYLHHLWIRIRPIHWGYFLAACLLFAGISVFAHRANNLKMIELRQAVFDADKHNTNVEGALQALREHVHSHMNTNLSRGDGIYPPLQLTHTYQRLQQAEQQRLQTQNAALYTQAQEYCEQQNPQGFSGGGRVPCIQQYVSERGQTVRQIPDALYKFNFVSPSWSPDLAGWTKLLAFVSLLLFAIRLGLGVLLKRLT